MLTLGRDGASAWGPPARLERLVKLVPNGQWEQRGLEAWPTQYNANWDMASGLRVVASYRMRPPTAESATPEEVRMFTIPPDVVDALGRRRLSKARVQRCPWWGFWPGEEVMEEIRAGRGRCKYSDNSYVPVALFQTYSMKAANSPSSSSTRDNSIHREPSTGSQAASPDTAENENDDYVLHVRGVSVGVADGSVTCLGA